MKTGVQAKRKFNFETLRVYLIILIFIFLFIYASLSIYLKYLAREAVNEAIVQVETSMPNINHINYDYVKFSPIDFFKQRLTLKNVRFHVNNPDLNVSLDSVTFTHFMSFTSNPLGPFSISFSGGRVDQFANVYGLIATWLNNPYLYSEFGNVPKQLALNLDGTVLYQPQNSHEVDLTFNVNNHQLALFSYQIKVVNLNLTAEFFTQLPAFLNALQASQITQIQYQANINYTMALNEIANLSPGLAQYLQSLGYQNFPISLQGSSVYNAKDTKETYHFNVAIKQVGSLAMDIDYQIINPPSLANTVNQLLGKADSNTQLAGDLIQSAHLSYQDASLITRMIQNLAQSSGNNVTETQIQLINLINNYAQSLKIPQMTSIAAQLDNFIMHPGTLVMSLNPTTPFSLDEIANFFGAQQDRNRALQARLAKLSGPERTKAYNAYLQQSFNAYSNFFNRIGLTVSAN